jgi:HK97 family phage prohead protease
VTGIIERRVTRGTVELRAAADDKGLGKVGGYAIVFNKRSQNLGGFVEQVDPSFPDQTLDNRMDVLVRYQHDSDMLLGRTDAETARLSKDGTGMEYEADLPDTSYARDLRALLARGDVRSSSFAFRVTTDGDSWGYTEQGFPERTLHRGIVIDAAPVVTPAYPDATSGLRSLAEQRGLDLGTVVQAAEHNELGQLMRSHDPKVIDLGAAAALTIRARLARLKMDTGQTQ